MEMEDWRNRRVRMIVRMKEVKMMVRMKEARRNLIKMNFVESFAGPEFGFKITRILNVLLLTQISAKMYCSQTSIKH